MNSNAANATASGSRSASVGRTVGVTRSDKRSVASLLTQSVGVVPLSTRPTPQHPRSRPLADSASEFIKRRRVSGSDSSDKVSSNS
jgi:hypothetical protein